MEFALGNVLDRSSCAWDQMVASKSVMVLRSWHTSERKRRRERLALVIFAQLLLHMTERYSMQILWEDMRIYNVRSSDTVTLMS